MFWGGQPEKEAMSGVSRRLVLKAGLVGVCSCLLPWRALAAENFYLTNRAQHLADFKSVCAGAEKWLAAKFPGQTAKAVTEDAMRRFERLLPGMPDIGGQSNRNQPFLIMAGWLTALFQAMRKKALPPATPAGCSTT